uniref:Pre-mRNA-splicing factor prp45 n=1 Tax=Arundo donax TaxID=35708 RepID=A0A0A8ZV49_ARUDO
MSKLLHQCACGAFNGYAKQCTFLGPMMFMYLCICSWWDLKTISIHIP